MPLPLKAKKFKKKEIWLSVSEAADLGGVGDKTIRRALKDSELLEYKIIKDRYKIELASLINFMDINTKLNNKFLNYGLGQYVEVWKNIKGLKVKKNK